MRRCMVCAQSVNHQQDFYRWLKYDSLLCGECLQQLQPLRKTYMHNGLKIHVLYEYNEFLENMLFQYKESLDVELRKCFFHEDHRYIEKRYRGYTLLLMPSNNTEIQKRGFHALKEMSEPIRLKKLQPFKKSDDHKQSTIHDEQHQPIRDSISLNQTIHLPKKRLLLLDDVCISGATLSSAFRLLQRQNLNAEALVLCAHPILIRDHS